MFCSDAFVLGFGGFGLIWFNYLSSPPSLLTPEMEPDRNPSFELQVLSFLEGMTGDQILWCWVRSSTEMGLSLQRCCASVVPSSWNSGELPSLAEHSTDSCLFSDPAAFGPVSRAPDRAHHLLVISGGRSEPPCAFSVTEAPSPRESIPAVPPRLDGAHPALPRAILCADIKSECFLQTQRLFHDAESLPAPFLPAGLWVCLKIALNI